MSTTKTKTHRLIKVNTFQPLNISPYRGSEYLNGRSERYSSLYPLQEENLSPSSRLQRVTINQKSPKRVAYKRTLFRYASQQELNYENSRQINALPEQSQYEYFPSIAPTLNQKSHGLTRNTSNPIIFSAAPPLKYQINNINSDPSAQTFAKKKNHLRTRSTPNLGEAKPIKVVCFPVTGYAQSIRTVLNPYQQYFHTVPKDSKGFKANRQAEKEVWNLSNNLFRRRCFQSLKLNKKIYKDFPILMTNKNKQRNLLGVINQPQPKPSWCL